jgi:hypothetical protein
MGRTSDQNRCGRPLGSATTERLRLGSLDTGMSVLMPLFTVHKIGFGSENPGYSARLTYSLLYIPRQLFYVDAITKERKEYAIRKMLDNPLTIDLYVKDRG